MQGRRRICRNPSLRLKKCLLHSRTWAPKILRSGTGIQLTANTLFSSTRDVLEWWREKYSVDQQQFCNWFFSPPVSEEVKLLKIIVNRWKIKGKRIVSEKDGICSNYFELFCSELSLGSWKVVSRVNKYWQLGKKKRFLFKKEIHKSYHVQQIFSSLTIPQFPVEKLVKSLDVLYRTLTHDSTILNLLWQKGKETLLIKVFRLAIHRSVRILFFSLNFSHI